MAGRLPRTILLISAKARCGSLADSGPAARDEVVAFARPAPRPDVDSAEAPGFASGVAIAAAGCDAGSDATLATGGAALGSRRAPMPTFCAGSITVSTAGGAGVTPVPAGAADPDCDGGCGAAFGSLRRAKASPNPPTATAATAPAARRRERREMGIMLR